jgi:DNA-directed RNA polymerase specialized sigma24 family protein
LFAVYPNTDSMTKNPTAANKNEITREAFDSLLAAFGDDREIAAQNYIELREKLRMFFTWRGFADADEHADETLNRTARRLAAGEEILDVRAYVFGVARFLCLEINRAEEKKRLALNELPAVINADREERINNQARLDCLQNCLQNLPEEDRSFIVNYYQGERNQKIANRKSLLERLNLSASGLRMRALRLREKLEICLHDCVKKGL